jgi:hypothetical protein
VKTFLVSIVYLALLTTAALSEAPLPAVPAAEGVSGAGAMDGGSMQQMLVESSQDGGYEE